MLAQLARHTLHRLGRHDDGGLVDRGHLLDHHIRQDLPERLQSGREVHGDQPRFISGCGVRAIFRCSWTIP